MPSYPSALSVRLIASGIPGCIALGVLVWASVAGDSALALVGLGIVATSICLFLQPFPRSRKSRLTQAQWRSLSLAPSGVLLGLSIGGSALVLVGSVLLVVHRVT